MLRKTALCLSVLLGLAAAQGSNQSSSCQCASSNDSPLQPGAYSEALRPQIHFSPSSGFMNDPNGLHYSNGTYHLYAQYNPTALVAGNQNWLHATSTDLIHWKNHEIAIRPAVGTGDGIFSGSVAVDVNNTSGFFNSSVPEQSRTVAMYTLYDGTTQAQTQELAYSSDAGYTFTKYSGNPVINLNQTQFRDPNVFWHAPTSRWIVTTVLAQHYQVIFYSSPDLKNWTELSRFGPHGVLGFQYEVPDLVEIKVEGTDITKWVLFISINPGAPLGGSFIQYFIGDFNGTTFVPDDYSTNVLDFGKDFYAGIHYANVPKEQGTLFQAWASNWQYTNVQPTTQDGGEWRTIQSLVRRLTIRQVSPNPQTQRYAVVSTPVGLDKLSPSGLYKGSVSSSPSSASSSSSSASSTTSSSTSNSNASQVVIPLTGNAAFDFNVTASSTSSSQNTSTLQIKIASGDAYGYESITIGYANAMLWIDRGNSQKSWYNPFFTDKLSTYVEPLSSSRPGVSLRGVIDRSVLELFVNDGIQSAVVLFFMSDGRRPGVMTVSVAEGMEADVSVASLQGIWDCGDCSASSSAGMRKRDEF